MLFLHFFILARVTSFTPKHTTHCLEWSFEPPAVGLREESVAGSPIGNDPELCRLIPNEVLLKDVIIDSTCTSAIAGDAMAIGESSSHGNIGMYRRVGDPNAKPHCTPISHGAVIPESAIAESDNASTALFHTMYATVNPQCDVWWREVSPDVVPPIPELSLSFGSSAHGYKLGLCRTFGVDLAVDAGHKIVGTFVQEGPDIAKCFFTRADGSVGMLDGGNFHILQASTTEYISCTDDPVLKEELTGSLTKNLQQFLLEEDRALLSRITGYPFRDLEMEVLRLGSCDLKQVLSPSRFVPHKLNERGLHVMRCLLAERLSDARAHIHGLANNSDYLDWKRDGFLIKDMDAIGDDGLHRLLQIVSAESILAVPLPPYSWVARNITVSEKPDPQNKAHVDTFATIVKVWIFDQSMTREEGPLMYSPGSNRNTEGKLRWMHAYSLPPAREALVEPSFRLLGSEPAIDAARDFVRQMQEQSLPMLPLPGVKRTLVIADTSGLHFRSVGLPGRTRVSWRLQGDTDGGLKRLNPFRSFAAERPDVVN